MLPAATKPSTSDFEALKRRELDENGFCRLPFGGTSDSGAADTVAPEELFNDYPLQPSPGSKADLWYVGAGGQRIQNRGQRTILVMTKEKRLRWITVQVAAVKKMLISVSKNNEANNEVIYRTSGSFIRDESNGDRLNLRKHRGTFVLDMWVVPYQMVRKGAVTFKDDHGETKSMKVDNTSSFTRQS